MSENIEDAESSSQEFDGVEIPDVDTASDDMNLTIEDRVDMLEKHQKETVYYIVGICICLVLLTFMILYKG